MSGACTLPEKRTRTGGAPLPEPGRSLRPYLAFPRYPETGHPLADRWDRFRARTRIRCPVCGGTTGLDRVEGNLREACLCRQCGSSNRKRQIAWVATRAVARSLQRPVESLRDLARVPGLTVYNTETEGCLHEALKDAPGYRASEYFGPGYESGTSVRGIRHEDLTRLSFESGSFDLVLTTDVLEHVPDPYAAHAEIYRVLRPGGRHVFTVPFVTTSALDLVTAEPDANGNPVFLGEPLYHEDPVRPEGIPVYRVFGLEMIVALGRIGFIPHVYDLHRPDAGILQQPAVFRGHHGTGTIVFDAVRPGRFREISS